MSLREAGSVSSQVTKQHYWEDSLLLPLKLVNKEVGKHLAGFALTFVRTLKKK
jgi:hypothetical protein